MKTIEIVVYHIILQIVQKSNIFHIYNILAIQTDKFLLE